MQEITAAVLGLLLFVTGAAARSSLSLRLAVLPAALLAGAALLRQPLWPVPALILLLGGGVLWSLAGKLERPLLGLDRDPGMEEEPTTKPLERALKMVPDTDPPLLVLVTQVLVAGVVLACHQWLGGGLLGAGCLGALALGFVVSLLLVRRPVSTWAVAVALAWTAWTVRAGLKGDPVLLLSGLGLFGALVLASVRESLGIVAVMLALVAASSAVQPAGGLVSWFAGWSLLIGLVLLYLLVGLGFMTKQPTLRE